MSINDQSLLNQTAKSSNLYPGIANPTKASGTTDPISSNFVNNPTTSTRGAGAGEHFEGHKHAERALKERGGVIEARPGIIESTHIDPLEDEDCHKDDK